MAEIRTTVELSKKEVEDAVMAAARSNLKESIGGVQIKFMMEGEEVNGAVVTFGGKVRI